MYIHIYIYVFDMWEIYLYIFPLQTYLYMLEYNYANYSYRNEFVYPTCENERFIKCTIQTQFRFCIVHWVALVFLLFFTHGVLKLFVCKYTCFS